MHTSSHIGVIRRYRRALVVLLAVGLAGLGLALTSAPAQAAGGSYSVRSTGNTADRNPGDGVCRTSAGTCTLRAALTEANLDRGPSRISFAIPGTGVHTINITTALPRLTDLAGGTVIDGYTQPGSSLNTDPLVDRAVLRIEIRGTGSSGPDALDIASPHNVVRGIAFYNLRLAVNMVFRGDANVIVGNFIGTNAAGTFRAPVSNVNSFGIVVDQLASNNVIGRPGAADRNVISGNSGRGVMLKDAVLNNRVQNNIIGLSPNGRARLPNADHGVDVNSGATGTLVGGTGRQEGNLVSGNDGHGVEVSHAPVTPTLRNQIIGNRIGTDPTGNTGPAYARNGDRFAHENVHTEDHVTGTVIAHNIIGNNRFGGIKIDNASAGTLIHDNRIGVSANGSPISNGRYGVQVELGSHNTVVGPGNLIAHNGSGIRLQGATTIHNTITRNSISANTRLGIDIAPLDLVNSAAVPTATNGGARFPVLASGTTASVSGRACPNCRVELFLADSTSTNPALERSYGEGRTFLASARARSDGAFRIAIAGSSQARTVTATATSLAGDTSEFSRNWVVPPTRGSAAPFRPFSSWDAFVARQLTDFTGSPGTAAGRAAAVRQLSTGSVTPAAFIRILLRRPYVDDHVAPVARLYKAYFGRLPDYHGLSYWARRHRSGTRLRAISQSLFASREFQRLHGSLSNRAFVMFVYRSVLARQPDARGISYWVRRLEAGTARGVVMSVLSESGESRRRTATEVDIAAVYGAMLHRAPTPGAVAAWKGRPLAELIDAVRFSAEYAGRVT